MVNTSVRFPVKGIGTTIAGAVILIALAGCGTGDGEGATSAPGVTQSPQTPAASGGVARSSEGTGLAEYIVLPGTGTYAIGTEAPFGGYQLSGQPPSQPAGCTWSIRNADGEASFEDQGSYVFLTDIHEAVTFVTEGCPDWEQFE